jgi:hypothetical protein
MIFEQRRVTLLHLLQKRQEVAVSLKEAVFGGLSKSPCSMSDQGRSVQPKPRQRKFARGSPWVEATVGEQQQVALARIVSWVPQDRVHRPGRPVGRLVQVAPPAAVHQVVPVISAAEGLRSMVIDGQRASAVRFRHAAVLARQACSGSDEFGILSGNRHAG